MAKKYPTPEEARSRFEAGVERNKDRWVEGCRSGAEDYQTWYVGFAKAVYPLIATLPPKTSDIDRTLRERIGPVLKKISEVAKAYRKVKAVEAQKKLAPTVPA
jgi:hypothetical protein